MGKKITLKDAIATSSSDEENITSIIERSKKRKIKLHVRNLTIFFNFRFISQFQVLRKSINQSHKKIKILQQNIRRKNKKIKSFSEMIQSRITLFKGM